MKKFIAIVWTVSMSLSMWGQSVEVSGKVVEKDQVTESVPFTTIMVQENGSGTSADFDGSFVLSLKPGSYHLVISNIGYATDTVQIQVPSSGLSGLQLTLSTNIESVEEFIIEAKKVKESETVLMMERKEAKGVEQNIGAQEMTKTGSSNAASGLSKVSGISLVGSQYVFVRGMGDRYNIAYLNGFPLASVDPDKKVMGLDIFPSSILSFMNIKKAFSPDLFADFAGGAIDIRTKDYPEDPTLELTLGAGYNTQSTFRRFQTYNGGNTDYLGVDDGTRSLPDQIAATDDYNSIPESENEYLFPQNLDPVYKNAPLNSSIKVYAGNYSPISFFKEGGVGYSILASHSNSTEYRQGLYRQINAQDVKQLDYQFDNYTNRTNSAGMGNVLSLIHI